MASNTTSTDRLPLRSGRWELDPNHSAVNFSIRHLGVSKVRGRFTKFDVDVTIGDTLESTTVTATIDVSSLDTDNADRDAHVLSPDILDVAKRPTLSYRSFQVKGSGATYRVDGELTIGEVTRPVYLDVDFGGVEPFADGRHHAGFEATTQISRRDFGIDIALPPGVGAAMIGDSVNIELDIRLLAPED